MRHAHADWQPDEARPLSSQGRRDAARVADLLAPRRLVAIYSSPARRAVETVEALAGRAGLRPVLVHDFREREIPVQPPGQFEAVVRASWIKAEETVPGGESLRMAQARALPAIRSLLSRHPEGDIVVATHGNLLASVVNALDSAYGYEFWKGLTFPDIYELRFRGTSYEGMRRLWNETGGQGPEAAASTEDGSPGCR